MARLEQEMTDETRRIPANKWYGGVVTVQEDKGGCVAQGGNGAVKTLTLTGRDALLTSTCSASGASAKANRPSALPPLAGRLLRMTTVVGSALQGAQARVVQSLLPVVLLVGGVVGLADEVFAQERPVLTLELTSSSISENGGVSSLTGSLNGTLDSDVTVQVETIPRGVAVAADLTQTGTTLTFAAGSTTPTGTVEFSAVNDDVYSGNRQMSILTSVSGSVTVPDTVFRLTITDDEAKPELTVDLTPSSIDEDGGASSLTASLSGATRFEVTVEVTAVDPRGSAAAEDVTQAGTTLTFAAGSTTPTGTVQFTAVDNDVNDGNREYSIRWRKEGDVQTVGATTEVLTITDDDEKPVLTLELTSSSISENGGVSSLTGSLNGTLDSDVTVQVETIPRGVAVAADLTQTGTTLTFAAGSTTPTGTVEFSAVNDDVYSGNRQMSILTSVSGSVTVPDTVFRLTITDDEAKPELTVDLTPSSIDEDGGASSLTASLSGATRFEVTVEVTAVDPRGSAAAEDVTQAGTTLTFAAGSTTPTGTVQFTAVDNDVNDGNREYSIRWRKEGDVQTVGATTEVLTITDDDEKPVLTLELTSSSISENGGVSSLTGSLNGTLDSDVTVQVETIPRGVAVAADLTQTGTTLTFAAGSTTPTGTVEFSAVNDDVYSGNRQMSILTSVSGSVTVPDTVFRLTITDDEAKPELTVDLTPSSIDEDGGASSLTASLSGATRFEVTVEVTAVDPRGSAAAEDVTQAGTTLTFAAGSTTPTGTVQFTAVDNDVYDGNREYSIRWRKEGDVQTVGATTEVLTITDDDEKPVLTLELTSSSISENGGVSSLTGSLNGTLDSDVTVQVETIPRGVAVAADLTQTGTTLTFQAGSTTPTGTVEFTAVNDDVYSGNKQMSILTSVSGSVTVPDTAFRLTITDDEMAGIVLSKLSLEVGEGTDASYTVKLPVEPLADVTVRIEGASGTDLTLDRSRLTFTPSTWSTAQTVTVSAGEDADSADDEATLTHTASEGYGSVSKDLDVTVVDDETAGIVLSESSLEVGEGADASYTVKLSAEPLADVTVRIEGASGTDLTLDRSRLTFTPSTWSTAQTVTVSAGEDADSADDEATLTHTASGGGYGSVSKDLDVTVVDDETAGIVLSESSLEVGEGADASYTVKLSAEPLADVTVRIEGASGTDLTLDRSRLTFTPSTWSTAQTVTVSAGEDADSADDEATLTHTASGGGYGSVSKDLDVTVVDDETAGIVLSESSLEVGEGADGSYTVKLSAEPSADVTVRIEGASGTDLTLDSSRLTFTPSTWSTAQTVTVSAGEDADLADDEATLTHTASGGGYGSASEDLDVTVVDDETAGIVLSESSLEVGEGADGSYTVKLSAEPSADVTVRIEGASGTDLTLDSSRLTFTPSTWSTAQTVTVSAGEDADSADDEATLTHTASGGGYGSASKDLDVTVIDDETASKAPEAVDDVVEMLEGTQSLIDVLANDWDPDGNRLSVVSVGAPAHGTVAVVSRRVRYSPHLHYHGVDRFTYMIADLTGLTSTATVAVTVLPVNHGPRGIGVIPDQLLEEGGAPVTVDLTSYFTNADGSPLTYETVSSDETAVTVMVAGATLTLSAVVTGTATVTVTARDVEGQTATQMFGVLVGDRLVQAVMTDTLAALGRGHLSSVRSTIGRHLQAGGGETTRMMVAGQFLSQDAWDRMDVGGLQQLHELLFRAAQLRQRLSATHVVGSSSDPWLARSGASGLMGGGFDGGRDRLLQGTDVLLSFGGQDEGPSNAGVGGPKWTVWGQGDLQTFRGAEAEREGYDGDLRTGYLGLDARLGEKWLVGAALARSGGRGDWQMGSSSGHLTTALTVVHPYLRWGDRDTSVWALAGIGQGTVENVRMLTGRRGTSPMGLGLGLVEGRRRLATTGPGLTMDLRGEASWARLRTGDGEETVDELEAGVRRVRTGVEVMLPLDGPGGLQMAPFGAVSTRHDGGAGQTGVGLELAGGVRLTGGRVRIEAQGRILALHTATDYAERGVSVTASVGAGQYEPGLTASVRPRWGAPGYGAESLWQDQFESYTYGEDRDDAAVHARVGYGLRLPGGRLLTPFGGYGQMGTGWRVQGGANLGIPGLSAADLAGPMQIEFMGERYSRREGVDHRFTLFGIVNLGR